MVVLEGAAWASQLLGNLIEWKRRLVKKTEWGTQARNANIPTSRTPQVGAIAQWDLAHVAVVERVNSNGTILISELSYSANLGGPADYLYRTRTISASNPTRFILPWAEVVAPIEATALGQPIAQEAIAFAVARAIASQTPH